MKFNQLEFELYIRDLLEEFKTEIDVYCISDIMTNIIDGVTEEIIDELEDK